MIMLFHRALLTTQKLAEFHWEILEHPPIYPIICLDHWKKRRGGKRFENDNDVEWFMHNWVVTQPQSFYGDGNQKAS